jgi:uncharacterized membrane protein YfcA
MTDPLSLFFIVISVLLLGLAKGGFGGVGAPVALPIMALGVPAELALGALLPILMAMDVVSVTAHRRNADFRAVFYALPGAVIGVLVGAGIIALVSTGFVGFCIGVLAIGFAVMALSGKSPDISHWPDWASSVFGALSGLTSALAHAGGPPIHIYFFARGYPAARFVATSACFMAGVNLIKVIPFIAIGALNKQALTLAAYVAPLAIMATFLGVLLSRVISKTIFKYTVNSLMIIAGAKLISDAVF